MSGSGSAEESWKGPRQTHMFHIADYSLFGLTLFVSLGIGVYQALSGGKQRTISEYLVAGRQMKILPVAISLMVSFESSITMLGMPAEAYVYGIQYLIGSLGYMVSQLAAIYFIVPLIHPLKLTSAYEYLELRFNSRLVRKFGSALGILNYVWYMGVVLFGPATALEAVTGFPMWSSIFLVTLAAVIYTSIGGLKAVIWTDVFQAVIMFAGIFAVLIKGTMEVGGPSEVWRRASQSGRTNLFEFDPDPTVRHTFWNLFIGKALRGMGLIFNQSSIQRISATSSVREAMIVMFLVSPGFLITFTLAVMEGIVAYSFYDYHRCDPLESNQITNPNQIAPFFVMDIFHSFPGMPGLFLAALFSASLSTISSGLSSLSALTWKDFVQPAFPNISEFKATLIAKLSVVVYGILSCGVAMLASKVGGPLTQISASILSAFSGPLAGLFVLGSLFPIANKKGAIVGCFASFALTLWISMGASFSKSRRVTPWLPAAPIDQCPGYNSSVFNSTTTADYYMVTQVTEEPNPGPQGIERVYLLSYVWFSTVALMGTLIVGLIVSYITASKSDKADPRYIVPIYKKICRHLPAFIREKLCCFGLLDESEEKAKFPGDGPEIDLTIERTETKKNGDLHETKDTATTPLLYSNGDVQKTEDSENTPAQPDGINKEGSEETIDKRSASEEVSEEQVVDIPIEVEVEDEVVDAAVENITRSVAHDKIMQGI